MMASDPLPVLMVIANQDFYYQEYSHTRLSLEEAGLDVAVAATTTNPSTPHPNSGQGSESGVVTPDLALSNVEASDYSAIVFVGGWGSSSYQYAFEGTYANSAYNGDLAAKAAVNGLINDFVADEKVVAAVCHAVTVLAWARVDGQSLLEGKTVAGYELSGPVATIDGQTYSPLSRWNVEVNGGTQLAERSIGDPATATDDVWIDGKIITGQNFDSARQFGRVVADEVLAEPDNHAPVLDVTKNPYLNTILEDTVNPAGTPIGNLLNGWSDSDLGDLKGMAIVSTAATQGRGLWQLSTNGGTSWQGLGTPSEEAARLLAADGQTRLRFVPNANFNGQVSLQYRAWDRTQGIAGGVFNVAGNTGGAGAFSTAIESAIQKVMPVNDAPLLSLSGSVGYVRNAEPIVLAPLATVKDVDSQNLAGGQLRVWISTGAGTSNVLGIGGGFTVDGTSVKLGTTTVATISGSSGTFTLTFNGQTTPAIAQQLVRAITFTTVDGSAGARKVHFSISDGDGGTSLERTKTVNVA
jgi:putative intracellular protease/amidase